MVINEDIKFITKRYLMIRGVMILFFLIFSIILNQSPREMLLYFDAERYVDIALNGYSIENYAFFPATVLVIKFFNFIKIPVIGYILFNITITYITTIYIYKICKEIYKYEFQDIKRIIYFWLLSPIALFTFNIYSDGLFLFFCITAFYFYKSRKNEILTGVLLGLAVFTRSFGAMLFFAIFIKIVVEIYMKKTPIKEWFIYVCKIYIPATIISLIYPIFLLIKTGNPLYFSEVQFTMWDRVPSNFFILLKTELELFNEAKEEVALVYVANSILFISAIIFIIITLKILNKNRVENLELILYIIFSLIACFSTMRFDGTAMPTCSMYRYLYGLFPLYIVKKGVVCQGVSCRLFFVLNIITISFYALDLFLT